MSRVESNVVNVRSSSRHAADLTLHGYPCSCWSCQCPCGCSTVVKRYVMVSPAFSLQGSPNLFDQSNATFRRSLCATAMRTAEDGTAYLYTLSLASPERSWSDLEGPFRQATDSFSLLPPGRDYVSPERDPWRFF